MNTDRQITRWITFALFAAIAFGCVLALRSQKAPWPVFITLSGDNPEQFFEFGDEPLEISFNAPNDRVRGAYFRVLFRDGKHQIKLHATNETTGETLGESIAGFGLDAPIEFTKPVAAGNRVRISFELVKSPAKLAPLVKRIKSGATPNLEIDLQTRIGDTLQEGFPQISLYYGSTWKPLLWYWLLVAVGLPVVIRWRAAIWPWLLLLGFCALLTSWLGWQQRYSSHYGHMDPDRYGAAGNFIAEWLQNPGDRPQMQEHLHNYQHTHVALVPVALATLILAVFPGEMHDAYVFFNAIASFATLLLIQQLLSRQLRLSWTISTLGTLLFATHLIFLRSFARPTTDQAGLLLVTMMLCLLVDRTQRRAAWQTLALAALVAPLIFVRPPGFAYAAFLIGMAPFCDWIREKRFQPLDHLLTVLKIAAVPLLAVAGIYAWFGLSHNFGLALEKRLDHINQWTLHWFRIALSVSVQILFIAWIFLRWRPETWRPILVFAIWILCHTLLLVVSQAPFLTRMMEPILPSLIALTCMGLDRFRDRPIAARIACAAILIVAAANLFIQIGNINFIGEPGPPWGEYFYM